MSEERDDSTFDALLRMSDRVVRFLSDELLRHHAEVGGSKDKTLAAVGLAMMSVGATAVNHVTKFPPDDDPGRVAYHEYIQRLRSLCSDSQEE